jgi:hypothetical protein
MAAIAHNIVGHLQFEQPRDYGVNVQLMRLRNHLSTFKARPNGHQKCRHILYGGGITMHPPKVFVLAPAVAKDSGRVGLNNEMTHRWMALKMALGQIGS